MEIARTGARSSGMMRRKTGFDGTRHPAHPGVYAV